MPNWCSNTTTVYGSVDDLTKFVEVVKSDERSDEVASDLDGFPEARIFATLLPFPENGHKNIELPDGGTGGSVFAKKDDIAGTIDGYQWCLDNWGTKWGDCHTRYEAELGEDYVEHGTQHVTFYYDTAWGPADFTQIAKMYPNLTFITKYEEGGMCFAGAWAWKDGEVVFDHTVNGDTNPLYPEHPDWDEMEEHPEKDLYGSYLDAMAKLIELLETQALRACGMSIHWIFAIGASEVNRDMVQRSG